MEKSTEMKQRILIVDDEELILNMLESFLKINGYLVDTAGGVYTAIKLMQSKCYDIIFLDKNMPEANGNPEGGIYLMKIARSLCPSSHLIMITGYPTIDTAKEAMQLGAFDYIVKPFRLDDIRLKLLQLSKYINNVEQLDKQAAELEDKTNKIVELNAALKVLLDRREEERKEFEETLVNNFNNMVLPYIEKLQRTKLLAVQENYLSILETNLAEIKSRFVTNLSLHHKGLTPTEMQVAALIKDGRETKDIADKLCISEKAVAFHRHNIRQKLNISNKKINLRSYLIDLS